MEKQATDLLDQLQVLESAGRTRLPAPIRVRDVCVTEQFVYGILFGNGSTGMASFPTAFRLGGPPISAPFLHTGQRAIVGIVPSGGPDWLMPDQLPSPQPTKISKATTPDPSIPGAML